jgi:hypothetical protein
MTKNTLEEMEGRLMQRKGRPILRAIGASIFTLALVMLLPAESQAQRQGGPPTTTPPVTTTPPTTRPPLSVPEPSTSVLLLIGLGMTGLGSYYMKRHKREA